MFIQRYPAHGFHPDQSRLTQAPTGSTALLQTQAETSVTPDTSGEWASGADVDPEFDQTPEVEEAVEKRFRTLLRHLALEGERRGWQPWL